MFQRLVSLGLKSQHLVKKVLQHWKKRLWPEKNSNKNSNICEHNFVFYFIFFIIFTHFQSSNNFTSAFAEIQIWHCSNSVFHCFPVLKPCILYLMFRGLLV
jgi:hypothetical protein